MLLLIPGYGVETECNRLNFKLGETRGFDGFDSLIQSGRARVFSWGCKENLSAREFVSPLRQWQLFAVEKAMTGEEMILANLDEVLKSGKINRIVCHSLGALLFCNYLEKYELPKSVKKIVFIQGCLDNEKFLVSKMWQMVQNDKFAFANYWCWWDQALISYSVLAKKSVIGLTPDKKLQKYSRFLPLTKLWNLHISSIRNRQIVDIC